MSGARATRSRATLPWFPIGIALALAVLAAGLLFLWAGESDSYGWTLLLGAPALVGFILGYLLKAHDGVLLLLAVLILVSVVGGLAFMGLGGFICALVFVALALLPTVAAVLLGAHLRRSLHSDDGSPKPSVPLVLILVVAGAMELEKRLTPELAPESVVTRRTLDLTPAEAWDRLVFYEEVPAPPPLLVRLRIPHPLGTEGRITRTGDVKLCRYTTGHLRKRVTEYFPGRLLAFDVIEQVGIEDRSAELLGGSFRFAPAAGGGTEVVLTTTYRPLLQARGAWRPFETAVARLLHQHVLNGMQAPLPAEPSLLAEGTWP